MKSVKILKPWGYEVLIEKNKKYMFKKLYMKKNHRCSLQFHKKKIETIFMLKGKLEITVGKKINNLETKILKPKESLTIKPKTIHRMKAISNSTYYEASSPEIKDVVRLHDDYKRV